MNRALCTLGILLVSFFPIAAFAQTPPVPPPSGLVTPPTTVDPQTGQPFPDPITGKPLIDPQTGQPFRHIIRFPINPRFPLNNQVPNFRHDPKFPNDPIKGPRFVPGLPRDFPIPMHPWYGVMDPRRVNYGKVIRYIQVRPRRVAVTGYVPAPGSLPGQYRQQVARIPGYIITETTTGYIYPQRWTVQQVNAGVYQWRVLRSEFRLK